MKPPPARELPVELQYASGRRRLIEGLKAIDSRNARACRFLCYTGLRSREGMTLSPGNMLTDTVIEFASKTRKVRIPLSTQAAALIDKHSPTTLMRAQGRRLRSPLNRIFGIKETPRGKRACVTPHDLRRLFKSVGTELGVDPTVLNLLVGHTVKGVDKHYIAKLRLSVLRAAAQKIADEIDNPSEVEDEEEIFALSLGQPSSEANPSENSTAERDSHLPICSVDDYLKGSANGMPPPIVPRHIHYLLREGLYELVWTVPMWELKDRFGLSDRGLAKICHRAGIPVPGRGYWTKIEAGQLIARPALPPPYRGLPRLIRIRGTPILTHGLPSRWEGAAPMQFRSAAHRPGAVKVAEGKDLCCALTQDCGRTAPRSERTYLVAHCRTKSVPVVPAPIRTWFADSRSVAVRAH